MKALFGFAAWMTIQYKPDVINASRACHQISTGFAGGRGYSSEGLGMRVTEVSFMEEWAKRWAVEAAAGGAGGEGLAAGEPVRAIDTNNMRRDRAECPAAFARKRLDSHAPPSSFT